MASFKEILRERKFFICLITIFTLLITVCVIVFSKTGSFFWLNSYHNKHCDIIGRLFTFLGDGLFSIIIGIIIFLVGKRLLGIHILIAYAISGILAQILKRLVKLPRPKAIISEQVYPYFIHGVTHSGWNSFPSGHTASAFALATILCLHSKTKWLQFIYFTLALLVGYSRIYLGQHFLVDVYFGAIIGMITGWVVFYYFTAKMLTLKNINPYSSKL